MKKNYKYYSGGPTSSSLKEVRIPITNMTDCKKLYEGTKFSIDDKVICAGEKGKDSCQVFGDYSSFRFYFKVEKSIGNHFDVRDVKSYIRSQVYIIIE